jgi:uncharacterized protein YabE (DUF348 family)
MQRASLQDIFVRRIFGVSTLGLAVGFLLLAFSMVAIASQTVNTQKRHIVSLYVDGTESSVPTKAKTVGELIKRADIDVGAYDLVEPSKDAKIDGDNFKINIYRARPVTIIDENEVTKVKTPYQGAKMIAEKAGLKVYPEDKITQSSSSDFVSEQILGEKVVIDRATKVNAVIFGEKQEIRTHGITIADLLREKGIAIGANERVSVPIDTPISADMAFEVWREGRQTITVEESIARTISQIKDNTQPLGYKQIQTEGNDGKRKVTYEIEIRNGKEFSRTELSSEVLVQALEQVVVIGTKSSGNGLTQAKGVYQFTDSNGVTHRETYYDLPMSVVMRNCGAGGQYTVRADGVKIDKDGYVIVAANLNLYPRCSVVETSLGLGKVYDTGGFALVHPHGFDLATDWSKRDGI